MRMEKCFYRNTNTNPSLAYQDDDVVVVVLTVVLLTTSLAAVAAELIETIQKGMESANICECLK